VPYHGQLDTACGDHLLKYYYLTDDSERSLAPFFSKPVLSACFNGVVIIGISLIICWPRQPLSEFVGENKIPMVFFIIFAATLIVNSYINLCCGCGELIRRGFYFVKYPPAIATFEKESDFFTYGLIGFLLQSQMMLLLFLPLLILAASISAVSFIPFLQALSILYFAALLCRMFGFMVYLIWGRTSMVGYFIARTFMIFFIFGTFFWVPFLNPLQILYLLNKSTGDIGLFFALYMTTVIFATLLLIGTNHFLIRRHLSEKGR
jgi:hypothetical protein